MLEGKKILVTGAASGIGRATAIRLAADGAQVTIGDINEQGLLETAGMMAIPPVVQTFDASDYESCAALVEQAAKDGLDALCNISGILRWGVSNKFSPEEFDLVMRINAGSVFALCRAALPHLVESEGCIVNTASTSGLVGIAYNTAYSASKHAVIGITKCLAVEYAARGVRVNAICPGGVNTPMTQQPNMPTSPEIDWPLVMRNAPKLKDGTCEPDDIAEMFAFLVSSRGRKATGGVFTVDGGQVAG